MTRESRFPAKTRFIHTMATRFDDSTASRARERERTVVRDVARVVHRRSSSSCRARGDERRSIERGTWARER